MCLQWNIGEGLQKFWNASPYSMSIIIESMSLIGKTYLTYSNGASHPDQFIYSKIKLDFQCSLNSDEIISHYNLFWIIDGSADYLIDFQKYSYSGNVLLCLNPGEIFKIEGEHIQEGYRIGFVDNFYCLDIHHKEIGCNGLLFNDFIGSRHINLPDGMKGEIEYLFTQIEATLQAEGVAKSEMLQSLLKVLLIKSAQLKKDQLPNEKYFKNHSLVVEFNRLVEKKFRVWHSVTAYAQALNLSPKSLTKKMSALGKKPSQIIQGRIILEAKRLLFHSAMSIKEIAFDLGFKDPPHFFKFFNNKIHQSPSQFRTTIRAKFEGSPRLDA